MSSCSCGRPVILARAVNRNYLIEHRKIRIDMGMMPYRSSGGNSGRLMTHGDFGVRASIVDSYESSSNFAKRMEQQPRPIACSSCNSKGHVECKWCGGTGFFIIGDNMLCEVPSKNTSCIICAGKGSMCCSDCKGTGFRAKWLGHPPILK